MRRGLMLFVLMGMMTVGCGAGINKGDVSLISIEEEWTLGNQLAGDIAQQMTILNDPVIDNYITKLGTTILRQAKGDTPIADRPWTFHVIDDPTINAFNIPGGHVYFHSQLILEAKDFSEVMGVMGHEVAHGLARHGVENLTKQYGLSMVVGLVLGNDPATYQEILASVLAGGAIMKFSRGAESEADRLGVGYMHGAGVDPEGLIDFFQVLIDLRGRQPSSIEQFFSSHPLTEDRIANVRAMIQNLPPAELTRIDRDFKAFQDAVRARASSS